MRNNYMVYCIDISNYTDTDIIDREEPNALLVWLNKHKKEITICISEEVFTDYEDAYLFSKVILKKGLIVAIFNSNENSWMCGRFT